MPAPNVNASVLYIDEDAMGKKLVASLRNRGIPLITAREANLVSQPDEKQLEYSTLKSCVLYTFNICDYYQLHTQWLAGGRDHSGMILAQQQPYLIGEQLNRLIRIRSQRTPADMRNKAEFLSNWG